MTDVMDPLDAIDVPEGAFGPNAMINSSGGILADPDAERALLGLVLLKPAVMAATVDEVGAGDFFDVMHRRVYEVCARAFDEGWAINIDAVIEGLGGDRDAKLTGDQTVGQFVAALCIGADTTLDAADVAQHIFECSERRAIDAEADGDLIEANKPFQSRMGLVLWEDQNAPGEAYEYAVEDLIPLGQMVLLVGESGTGKSFLGHSLGLAIARNRPFFGRRILERMGVIWLAYEAAAGVEARMRAYARHHDLPIDHLPFAVLKRPAKLWPADDSVDALLKEIKGIQRHRFGGIKLGAIFVDTHNAGTPGASEIDSETVSKIRDRYLLLARETGAALVIIGHTNSQGKHRGNEQLHNNVDTVIKVSRKTRTMGKEVFPIKDDDGREIRTLRVAKQREGQDGAEHDFVLVSVEDGTTNRFGRKRTSCVIASPNIADAPSDRDSSDAPRERIGVRATKNDLLFMRCLLEAIGEQGIVPPPELDLARSIARVVDYEAVKRLFAAQMLRDDDDSEEGRKRHRGRVRTALTRCRVNLLELKVIGCSTPHIWWTGKAVNGIRETYPKTRTLFDDADAPLPDDDIAGLY